MNPHDIPGAYSEDKHAALSCTIAGRESHMHSQVVQMACHETPEGGESPCVGWLVNQLGPGNNIALRMRVMFGNIDGDVETVGPQHDCLAATLPGGAL